MPSMSDIGPYEACTLCIQIRWVIYWNEELWNGGNWHISNRALWNQWHRKVPIIKKKLAR